MEVINSCVHFNGGCEHMCEHSSGGPRCSCHEGYRLKSDRKSCEVSHLILILENVENIP